MLQINVVPTNTFLTIYRIIRLFLLAVIFTVTQVHANAQQNAQNHGDSRMHSSSQMAFYGDLTNSGFFANNKGTAYFEGKRLQNIFGTRAIDFQNLTLSNSNGVMLHTPVTVTSNLKFPKRFVAYTSNDSLQLI